MAEKSQVGGRAFSRRQRRFVKAMKHTEWGKNFLKLREMNS